MSFLVYNIIMLKKCFSIISTIICFIVFLYLLIAIAMNKSLYIDNLGALIAGNRIVFFDIFFKVFTYIGSVYFMVGVCVVWLICDKDKKRAWSVVTCLAVVGLLNLFVKLGVGRARPDYGLISESGMSFPSGHAMISVCFYGYIAYMLAAIKNKHGWIYGLIAGILSILLGFSRIYLGVHYVSDVLAGLALGCVVLYIYILVYSKIRHKK